MKRILIFLYQWIILIPVFVVLTVITTTIMMILSPIFGNKFWGYYPPKWWARFTCWLSLCRVKTIGHENIDKNTSYVFIANHQGAFDIFLVYGFLNQNIKWVQKASLRKLPFVGKASEIAGHVFVDNTSIASRRDTIIRAKREIVGGVSMMMFPEGARSKDGKLLTFRRGAYRVAMDMKLPIVPITINGPFDVLKANSMKFTPGRLEMVIHKPIPTENLETKDLRDLMNQTKEIIYADLWDKYK
ncbi:MAG TPA: lysophospholipid acyltransferase family protein [Dysgonamonadaceae bacterium]|jgi:1-acyl-sn-glycerol-3-phosphate acyltransferase|nr:lysophospholipid acyltransferase family protein [Dysgonamonadaceae bacterium]